MAGQKTFYCTISQVDGPLFEGDAQSVTVPGIDGEMTVLASHEPFISPLREGVITVLTEGSETKSYPVTNGTIEVHDNVVSILL